MGSAPPLPVSLHGRLYAMRVLDQRQYNMLSLGYAHPKSLFPIERLGPCKTLIAVCNKRQLSASHPAAPVSLPRTLESRLGGNGLLNSKFSPVVEVRTHLKHPNVCSRTPRPHSPSPRTLHRILASPLSCFLLSHEPCIWVVSSVLHDIGYRGAYKIITG